MRRKFDPSKLIKLGKVPALIMELTGVVRTRVTVYNWARAGRISAHGQRVKLRTDNRLGQLFTTKEDVIKFLQELG